jgi:peroxiredoxin
MAKRRKGKGKHFKKDVEDIPEDSTDEKIDRSDRRGKRRSKKNKKASKQQRQMKKRKDDIVFFSVLIIIVASIFGAYFAYDIYFKDSDDDDNNQNNGFTHIPDIGEKAPNFELKDTDGVEFTLSEYLGEIVVLEFITDANFQSHDEIIHLGEIYLEYNDKGVSILSIGVSDKEDYIQIRDNLKMANDCKWRFSAYGGDVSENYGVVHIPTIFIIDQEGNLIFKNVGLSDAQMIREVLDEHI